MTKAEFEALKARLREQKEKAVDLEQMVAPLLKLAEAVWVLLPAEVRDVLEKYREE